jgi:hypothetical protein
MNNNSQNNITNKQLNKRDNFLSLNFQNPNLIFVFKKMEKISTAIFLVTNFFDDKEVLKMSLRKISLETLRTILSLNDSDLYNKQNIIKKINLNFVELASYFEIAFYAGLISEMNYDLISDQIVILNNELQDILNNEFNLLNNTFEKDFFQANRQELNKETGSSLNVNNYYTKYPNTNILKKTNSVSDKISIPNLNARLKIKDINEKDKNPNKTSIKDNKIHKGQSNTEMSFKGSKNDFLNFINQKTNQNISKGQNTAKPFVPKNKEIKIETRRQKIIDEIKVKKEVTIKDLTDKFTDISEKTIQRELIKMVEDQILLKQGERRWSKYSLKN